METQTCTTCKIDKPIEDYSRRKGMRRHSVCKSCVNTYCKEHYRDNKRMYLDRNKKMRVKLVKLVADLKRVPCAVCGKTFPPVAMDFDHRDPSEKLCNINELVQKRMSVDKILAEIAKCDVLCACCHRIRHWPDEAIAPD